ncbi:MAG TPA: YsnF/AvaK domain-containing protein [Verrucomicrobiae bacterium]|nr:YsnF/AvaK domain-containing protein [Verrucomicrobiae bacterium]
MVALVAFLGAGCSCTHRTTATSYNKPAPIYPAEAGAPPAEVQTETGAATQAGNVVIPLEKEQMQVGTTQVPAGSVRIRKYVKTETVNQPVQVQSESVSIERLPAGAAPPAGAQPQPGQGNISQPFQSGEVVIPLYKQEPVVSTQVVPSGSVVVNKQQQTQTVNVQRQLREEEVAAVPSGNPSNVHISGVPEAAPGAPNEAAGAPPSSYGQTTGAGTGGITQIDQLTSAADPTSMAGQQVNLSNLPVQKVVGEHLIVVTSSNGTPVYIHTTEPVSGISAGQMVSVNGVVQPAPSTPSSQGWDQQSAQALQGQRIYIDARKVAPASQ